MFIYVGNSDYSSGPQGGSPKDAVSVFDFNSASGAFTPIQTIGGVLNPGYLGCNPRLPVLYVVERWVTPNQSRWDTPDQIQLTPEQQKSDCVRAFAINPQNGTLSEIGRRSTGGRSPMHINLHPGGRFAAFANPGRPADPNPEGHITVLRLGPDGVPGDLCASETYRGRPPVWRRNRPRPYPHSVFADSTWKRLFSPCLMADQVLIYRFDEKTGALSPSEQPYAQTSSGSGPRHMAFHPSGRFFYVTNEFDATVSAFAHEGETGLTTIVQTASFHPEGFEGRKNGCHILVGPTGRFLYCSNRSYQCITVFAIDVATGELRLVGHRRTLGDWPRDFVFDPGGRFLLVTNQRGNTVVSFHVDPDTGDLRPTGHSIETHAPNCVVFGPTQGSAGQTST